MAHNESRAYQIRGNCGVPATAKAAMLNLTAFSPTNFGYLTIWPAGITKPVASTVTFVPNSTTANGTFVALSQTETNDLGVYSYHPAGTIHVIIDVFGYFD
jgi:hypothetical protein